MKKLLKAAKKAGKSGQDIDVIRDTFTHAILKDGAIDYSATLKFQQVLSPLIKSGAIACPLTFESGAVIPIEQALAINTTVRLCPLTGRVQGDNTPDWDGVSEEMQGFAAFIQGRVDDFGGAYILAKLIREKSEALQGLRQLWMQLSASDRAGYIEELIPATPASTPAPQAEPVVYRDGGFDRGDDFSDEEWGRGRMRRGKR